MTDFVLGQYLPGSSFIHRLNPGSKILLSLFFMSVILLTNDWVGNLILTIFILLMVKIIRISIRSLYRSTKPLMLIILITAGFQLLFNDQGKLLWQLGIIKITRDGIVDSGLVFMRLMLIIGISMILTLSTPPVEIANGIQDLLWPLKKLQVPVETISLMISISLRFVPILAKELQTIKKAQRSRGVDFRRGSLILRSQKFVKLLVPLLFNSFNRAQILSWAMISRGYQNESKRTRNPNYRWHVNDVIAWGVALVVNLIVLANRK